MKFLEIIDEKIQKKADAKKELIISLKGTKVKKEEKHCEICGRLVGVMTNEAWESGDKICEMCGREKDLEEGEGE